MTSDICSLNTWSNEKAWIYHGQSPIWSSFGGQNRGPYIRYLVYNSHTMESTERQIPQASNYKPIAKFQLWGMYIIKAMKVNERACHTLSNRLLCAIISPLWAQTKRQNRVIWSLLAKCHFSRLHSQLGWGVQTRNNHESILFRTFRAK